MTTLTNYFSGMRTSIRPIRHLRSDRLWEIDALRGIAIVMMVVYHFMWDLMGLGGYDINIYTGFWHYWQRITASLFIGLVGVSLTLSRSRAQQKGLTDRAIWKSQAMRGAIIFSWGIVIGIVTYFVDPERYVRFGILHFIGFSIIIAYPFLRFRWLNLILGLIIILIAKIIPFLGLDISWLGWLGVNAVPRPAFDFFPVLPWFGVVLIGVFLGNTLWPEGKRRFSLPPIASNSIMRWLRLSGQNSLLIYLVHQPIMITILTLLGVVHL